MKLRSLPLFLLSLLFFLWAASDFYNFFTAGQNALSYYANRDVAPLIRDLVRAQLTGGLIKAGVGGILAVLSFRVPRNKA